MEALRDLHQVDRGQSYVADGLIMIAGKTADEFAANPDYLRATLQLDDGRLGLEAEVPGLEVQFDPSHLHQVLWNLCDNALKHAAGDASTPVLLRIGRIASTSRPYLEVADRGTGIDPANAERIFEPFFTNGTGGTGLGLFISRELCQTNGALLAYEARTEGGSSFRIIFADPQRWEG
jgi:two-component system sensor histidine kinase PilS (NtrC family)